MHCLKLVLDNTAYIALQAGFRQVAISSRAGAQDSNQSIKTGVMFIHPFHYWLIDVFKYLVNHRTLLIGGGQFQSPLK